TTTLIDKSVNFLVIQSLSKSRALAGLRVGFALGSQALIDALIRMKDSFNSSPVDRLALVGAQAAMEDKTYFMEVTEKIVKTRTWVQEELQALNFNVLPSATNFVFASHETFPAEQLYEELRQRNML